VKIVDYFGEIVDVRETERPYFDLSTDDVFAKFDECPDDPVVVEAVAYELQFRKGGSGEKKAEILKTLILLLRNEIVPCIEDSGFPDEENGPGFDFPHVPDSINVRRNATKFDTASWREIGLLRASGYQVGATNGVVESERLKILNYIFLYDDLVDVSDRQYAAEWGDPKTGKRLQKMANSLASFIGQAQRRNSSGLLQAITEWKHDLGYLRSAYYDRWGNFPWPEADIPGDF
jgi:hypothetical protein